MDLIVLPGDEKVANKVWADSIAVVLQPLFGHVTIQYYEHWHHGGDAIDVDTEIVQFESLSRPFKNLGVIAKGAGVLVALKAIANNMVRPQQAVFIGIPLVWGRTKGYTNEREYPVGLWLQHHSIPTLFIQETRDAITPAEELELYLRMHGSKNSQLMAVEDERHGYDNVTQLGSMITDFLGGKSVHDSSLVAHQRLELS